MSGTIVDVVTIDGKQLSPEKMRELQEYIDSYSPEMDSKPLKPTEAT